ncbi:FHA domain-containing protein [Actinoplanes subtropicus]|uniref:FHA domain-containing protein n=1 Tax=Actinoplanes subtropicus TaxID=543632 RepID=UPI000689AEF2|nr:FHA domain-containing protein [Actinoplanes subtropicus]
MSEPGLVVLRAAEILDGWWMGVQGVTPARAERAIRRVLLARGLPSGDGTVYPPAAVLYLPPACYRRSGPLVEAELPAMERRVAARLDRDDPAPLRLSVRPDARVRRPQVAAPAVGDVAAVRRRRRRDIDRTLLNATLLDPARYTPGAAGLALRPRDGAAPPIPVPAGGLVVGRDDRRFGRILDSSASRRHLELTPAGAGLLRCRDLGSRNGTWVDGVRITEAVDLRPGQRLRVGDTEFHLVLHDCSHRSAVAQK